jgi:hypothetical protein
MMLQRQPHYTLMNGSSPQLLPRHSERHVFLLLAHSQSVRLECQILDVHPIILQARLTGRKRMSHLNPMGTAFIVPDFHIPSDVVSRAGSSSVRYCRHTDPINTKKDRSIRSTCSGVRSSYHLRSKTCGSGKMERSLCNESIDTEAISQLPISN